MTARLHFLHLDGRASSAACPGFRDWILNVPSAYLDDMSPISSFTYGPDNEKFCLDDLIAERNYTQPELDGNEGAVKPLLEALARGAGLLDDPAYVEGCRSPFGLFPRCIQELGGDVQDRFSTEQVPADSFFTIIFTRIP